MFITGPYLKDHSLRYDEEAGMWTAEIGLQSETILLDNMNRLPCAVFHTNATSLAVQSDESDRDSRETVFSSKYSQDVFVIYFDEDITEQAWLVEFCSSVNSDLTVYVQQAFDEGDLHNMLAYYMSVNTSTDFGYDVVHLTSTKIATKWNALMASAIQVSDVQVPVDDDRWEKLMSDWISTISPTVGPSCSYIEFVEQSRSAMERHCHVYYPAINTEKMPNWLEVYYLMINLEAEFGNRWMGLRIRLPEKNDSSWLAESVLAGWYRDDWGCLTFPAGRHGFEKNVDHFFVGTSVAKQHPCHARLQTLVKHWSRYFKGDPQLAFLSTDEKTLFLVVNTSTKTEPDIPPAIYADSTLDCDRRDLSASVALFIEQTLAHNCRWLLGGTNNKLMALLKEFNGLC